MAKKNTNTVTLTQEELSSIIAQAVAQALAQEKPKKSTGKAQPKAEKVAFTKHDGSVIYGTPKQVAAWTKWQNREFKPLDEVKAEYEAKRSAYKPSKALKDAIKSNRAAITRKVAVEQYGFVGTKDDLKALKDSICK